MMAADGVTHFNIDNPFSIEEIEFQAEDELISIIPKFKHTEFNFLSGTFGPFIPSMEVQVPLWLAINLRKRQQCQIKPPSWLEIDSLTEISEKESSSSNELQSISYHYIETASLLFSVANDDISEVDRIRTTLEDIQNIRMAKIRRGIQSLAKTVQDGDLIASVNLTNIAALEIFQIRSFLMSSLNQFRQLSLAPTTLSRQTEASSSSSTYSSSSSSSLLSARRRSGVPSIAAEGEEEDAAAMPTSTRKIRRTH